MSDTNTDGEQEYNLDPDVVEELENVVSEEQIIGSYTTDGKGDERTNIISQWFPDNSEWQGKTKISAREARVLAMVRNLPYAYEEIEELQPFIENLVTDLEMYLTSVDGLAREQQKQVLMAMFGKTPEGSDAQSMIMGALMGEQKDD